MMRIWIAIVYLSEYHLQQFGWIRSSSRTEYVQRELGMQQGRQYCMSSRSIQSRLIQTAPRKRGSDYAVVRRAIFRPCGSCHCTAFFGTTTTTTTAMIAGTDSFSHCLSAERVRRDSGVYSSTILRVFSRMVIGAGVVDLVLLK
jgi:hypothetical protein